MIAKASAKPIKVMIQKSRLSLPVFAPLYRYVRFWGNFILFLLAKIKTHHSIGKSPFNKDAQYKCFP